jgi:hypothetical protein
MKHISQVITPLRSLPFEVLKPAIVALAPADRAYLRRWLLRYVSDHGELDKPESRPAPTPFGQRTGR